MFYIFHICPLHFSNTKKTFPSNSYSSSRVATAMQLKCLKLTIAEAKLQLKAQSKISLTCYPENAPLESRLPVKHYYKMQSNLMKTLK